jgi:hypothetical protein
MSTSENSIYQSLAAAFMILAMHLLLLVSVGIVVLFFYGIINHSFWMVIAISCFFIGCFWLLRRIRASRNVLNEVAGGSFKGKTVEVRLLGGVANFKISDAQSDPQVGHEQANSPKQLAAPPQENVTTLTELARLYENNLITREEYSRAKEDLFK